MAPRIELTHATDKQSDLESEISSSSDGPAPQQQQQDDEGERALREQEKTARRVAKRKAQQQHQVKKEARPAKRARVRAPAQPVLYAGEKRSSARSHAVRVADEVERRLTEDAKRAKTPIAREEVVPLTQAERLAEAKLTEKRNVDSLNSLVRDEEERKAAQRALALRKRVPAPTVRQISRASGTSIVFEHVEVEDPVAMLVPHQPTERPPRWTCAFTGKPAKYHDPATGVYYSDAIAYAGIKRITAHEFAWSGELSTFLEPS